MVEARFAGIPGAAWRLRLSQMDRIAPNASEWIRARAAQGIRTASFGNRVVLQLAPGQPIPSDALQRTGTRLDRPVQPGLWILQARHPWAALQAAQELSREPGVHSAAPVMRRALALHRAFSARPADPYFTNQWHLENRDLAGALLGPDTNPREAWTVSQGAGVTVGIGDDGFEVNHPDLLEAARDEAHFDFILNRGTASTYGSHATAVAGLIAARGDNGIGVTGVAPRAKLASFAIFDANDEIASDERLMDMFQHSIQTVGVQNHSWGNATDALLGPSLLESTAISNAVNHGRGGRGVVMIRSGGNQREYEDEFGSVYEGDVNYDGYANDPRVIAVAAIRRDGRVASYSNTGACILVGAPSGDASDPFDPSDNLFTTDRVGRQGYNRVTSLGDLANYAYGDDNGFSGTSAAAPEIAGLAALLVSANTNLTVRDVQQILIHASHPVGPPDAFSVTNAAGYRVGHNQGFGMPDAGLAVRLAQSWSNRPPLEVLTVPGTQVAQSIPDDGLKLWITENSGTERAVRCYPALGPHADSPTGRLPLVFVGRATNAISQDLRGKAALIERGTNFFRDKIAFAAQAGAEFAVIYNHLDGDALITPAATHFDAIPAVFISENDGRALVASLEGGASLDGQIRLEAATFTFQVTNTLACEHVGLRLSSDHPRRGDLRITLVSPSGTRSILQRRNHDTEIGPEDWTFWSVQSFGESSAGTWTVSVADELLDEAGSVLSADLILRGTPIQDADRDGLEDAWENTFFGSLSASASADPDQDGRSNAAELHLGTSPVAANEPFTVTASRYDAGLLRLAWPTRPGVSYEVLGDTPLPGLSNVVAQIPGALPTADLVVPVQSGEARLFQVREKAP